MKRKIAFFDFDGTITKKDTLLEFIKFSKGGFIFFIGFLIFSPYLIAYKLKIVSNQYAKEKILTFFFKNMSVGHFQKLCDQFAEKVVPKLIRRAALEEIEKLKKKNAVVVIVSASPENWIKNWAKELDLEFIGTCLEIHNGKLTGRISGKNCYGTEKVKRIKDNYNLADYEEIFAYGDSSGDKPMLNLSTFNYFKPFR